jgi:beta-xylosidase
MSKTLINFRCPEDVIDTFDETCRFKNMNRTQTLIELMRNHVIEKQEEIENWNTLYQMTGRRPRVGV